MSERLEDLNDDVRYPARRKMVIFLIVSFSLFALIFAAVEIENWRGRSAWNKYRREAEAKGETFDILKLAPPQVPNESNFASVPMFAKLFEIYRDEKGKPNLRETDELKKSTFHIYGASDITPPDLGDWMAGSKINLSNWQTYYQKVKMETNDGRSQSPFGDRYDRKDDSKQSADHAFPTPEFPETPAEDVLLALSKFDASLVELRLASARPFSRFPINYEDHVLALFPHLPKLRFATQFLCLRAVANLTAGRPGDSGEDIILSLRVSNASSGEPSSLSQHTRMALVKTALQPLREGLDEQMWNDSQLLAFQKELGQFNFLESYQLAIRGERALAKLTLEMVRTNRSELGYSCLCEAEGGDGFKMRNAHYYLMPDGWFYQNQLTMSGLYEPALNLVDLPSQRIDKGRIRHFSQAVADCRQGFVPYTHIAAMLFPAVEKSLFKFAFAQTAVDQANLVCALERHRLAHGSFPKALADLSPNFIEKIPHDIINGEPLKYRRTEDGKFILYSVGWNETDDGGTVALSHSGRGHRMEEGDWVWQYSTNSSNAKLSGSISDFQ